MAWWLAAAGALVLLSCSGDDQGQATDVPISALVDTDERFGGTNSDSDIAAAIEASVDADLSFTSTQTGLFADCDQIDTDAVSTILGADVEADPDAFTFTLDPYRSCTLIAEGSAATTESGIALVCVHLAPDLGGLDAWTFLGDEAGLVNEVDGLGDYAAWGKMIPEFEFVGLLVEDNETQALIDVRQWDGDSYSEGTVPTLILALAQIISDLST